MLSMDVRGRVGAVDGGRCSCVRQLGVLLVSKIAGMLRVAGVRGCWETAVLAFDAVERCASGALDVLVRCFTASVCPAQW